MTIPQLPYETKSTGTPKEGQNTPFHNTQAILSNLETLEQNIEKKVEQKMQDTHETMTQILSHLQRPVMGAEPMQGVQTLEQKHQKAILDYMRGGNETSLRNFDTKAYRSDATGADGGFLISPQMSSQIYRTMDEASVMRKVCSVFTTYSSSLEFLIDPDTYGAGWAAETTARTESSTGLFRKVTIPTYDLYAMPKATQRLLDDSAFNLEEWISARVAEKFSQAENNAFIVGDGSSKPTGFLSKTQVDNSTYSWGNIGYLKTGAAATLHATKPHDVLIEAVYALPAQYRSGAVWLMNSKTASELRKVKDANGRYLWNDFREGGAFESNLMGYNVYISEDMPDIGTNTTPIAFGNFKKAYAIVDTNDVRILRDPYTSKPHVFFYIVKRTGGDVIDFAAIKLVKCMV